MTSSTDQTGLEQPAISEEVRSFALPLLLIVFPLAVALLPTPVFTLIVLASASFLAYQLNCLRGFLWTFGIAFVLNLFVFSGAISYFDIDAYIAPQIRLIAASSELAPDGFLNYTHLALPRGFTAWCAAWYRITGSIDCGGMLFFMLVSAAWRVLRSELSRVQTLALLLSPAAFPSLFCLMSDGCVYLLLLMALVSLKNPKWFWVPLLASVAAALFKTSAWIPCALTALLLVRNHPRRWWQIALIGCVTLLCSWPTLRLMWQGGLADISADFTTANAAAQEMGYFARLAYVYIGHWTSSAQPFLGAHLGGVDGGGVDGLGPIFRVAVMAAIVVVILFRKRLKPWAFPLLLAWGSVLLMPTTYIGYARYVPWLYPAVVLPLVLMLPRLSLGLSSAMCVMPLMWLGWRIALSTEYVAVATHATAVHSDFYNIRCAFRAQLVEQAQPTTSGSLLYTYTMSPEYFPAMERKVTTDLKQRPASDKVNDVKVYALKTWLPWALKQGPVYVYDLMRLRCRWLLTPRGVSDGISTAHD